MPAVKRPEPEQLAMESVVAAAAIPAPDFAAPEWPVRDGSPDTRSCAILTAGTELNSNCAAMSGKRKIDPKEIATAFWTAEMDKRLLKLEGSGYPVVEIAERLGTTAGNVHQRAYLLRRVAPAHVFR